MISAAPPMPSQSGKLFFCFFLFADLCACEGRWALFRAAACAAGRLFFSNFPMKTLLIMTSGIKPQGEYKLKSSFLCNLYYISRKTKSNYDFITKV